MPGPVDKFEDLEAWRAARALTVYVYELTRGEAFRRDMSLAGQMQRASVSAMSNIAEGFERYRRTEFRQFVSMAKASCAEVRSQAYVALDVGYISPDHFDELMSLANRLARLLNGLLNYLGSER